MRQLRASILLLLFIATFGRCFAEQYGVLGDNDLACCVEECSRTAHCDEDEPPHHHDEGTPDCPVCVIIDSSALLTPSPAELPPPAFTFESSFFAIDAWDAEFLHLFRSPCDPGEVPVPPSPPRHSPSLTDLVLCSAPVRGPSAA